MSPVRAGHAEHSCSRPARLRTVGPNLERTEVRRDWHETWARPSHLLALGPPGSPQPQSTPLSIPADAWQPGTVPANLIESHEVGASPEARGYILCEGDQIARGPLGFGSGLRGLKSMLVGVPLPDRVKDR